MIGLLLLIDSEEDKIFFRRIYEKISRKLFQISVGIVKNKQDAEDIVHDVFLKIAGDYNRYRGKSEKEIFSLCLIMTRNDSLNFVNAKKRHGRIVKEFEKELTREGSDPLKNVLRRENVAVLERSLLKLRAMERDILILRYYHKLSYREIGRLLGLSPKAVDMNLYRIKKKLREELINEEGKRK